MSPVASFVRIKHRFQSNCHLGEVVFSLQTIRAVLRDNLFCRFSKQHVHILLACWFELCVKAYTRFYMQTVVIPYSEGIDFRRQNQTYVNVRFWLLKSILAL